MAASQLEIREAHERDYREIAIVQEQSPESAQWPVGDYSGYPMFVAILGGEFAGFCSWRQASGDEAEILNIAVTPALRRRGVGAALLHAVCERARGAVFLEVAEQNTAAIALYRKLGWRECGLRRGYYQGNVNAVVMKKGSC